MTYIFSATLYFLSTFPSKSNGQSWLPPPSALVLSPAFLIVCSCSLGREIKGAFRNWMSGEGAGSKLKKRQIGIKEWKNGLCTGQLEMMKCSRASPFKYQGIAQEMWFAADLIVWHGSAWLPLSLSLFMAQRPEFKAGYDALIFARIPMYFGSYYAKSCRAVLHARRKRIRFLI